METIEKSNRFSIILRNQEKVKGPEPSTPPPQLTLRPSFVVRVGSESESAHRSLPLSVRRFCAAVWFRVQPSERVVQPSLPRTAPCCWTRSPR